MEDRYTVRKLHESDNFPYRESRIRHFIRTGQLKAENLQDEHKPFYVIKKEEVERFLNTFKKNSNE